MEENGSSKKSARATHNGAASSSKIAASASLEYLSTSQDDQLICADEVKEAKEVRRHQGFCWFCKKPCDLCIKRDLRKETFKYARAVGFIGIKE